MYLFVVAETTVNLFNLISFHFFPVFLDTEQPVPVTTKAPHMTGSDARYNRNFSGLSHRNVFREP